MGLCAHRPPGRCVFSGPGGVSGLCPSIGRCLEHRSSVSVYLHDGADILIGFLADYGGRILWYDPLVGALSERVRGRWYVKHAAHP